MLLKIKISNFYSIRNEVEFSMEATSIREKKNFTFYPYNYDWNTKLLKSAVISGFNSAGKSNLLKAIAAIKYCVLYSAASADNLFEQSIIPFLLYKYDSDESMKPTLLEIEFYQDENKYRYGFEIIGGAIEQEWLFYTEPKLRENNLFVRIKNSIKFNRNWNKESEKMVETISKRPKENTLFLSSLAFLNVSPATSIVEWFKKIHIVDNIDINELSNYTAHQINDSNYRPIVNQLIKQAKLGFENVELKRPESYRKVEEKFSKDFISFMISNELIPNENYKVFTKHPVYNSKGKVVDTKMFELASQESNGTRKFFALIGLFLSAIVKRQILIIDELDTQFHVELYETLFKFFNTTSFNKMGAQLIFTTHNNHLLSGKKLRRDQFYIIKKNERGESEIERFHSKAKKTRTDVSMDKNYLDEDSNSFPNLDFNLFTGKLDFPE